MCGLMINVCYYGGSVVNFNKTQTVRNNYISTYKNEVVTIFTDATVFDKERNLTS